MLQPEFEFVVEMCEWLGVPDRRHRTTHARRVRAQRALELAVARLRAGPSSRIAARVQPQRAKRRPVNCQRASGGKKLR